MLAGVICTSFLTSAKISEAAIQTPERLLATAIKGAFCAFRGTEETVQGDIQFRDTLTEDGHGGMLRQYSDGSRILSTLKGTWRMARDGKWMSLPYTDETNPEWKLKHILAGYHIKSLPASRILNVLTIPLSIMPRVTGLSSQKIWVDPATGIVLQNEMYGSDGKLKSRTRLINWNRASNIPLMKPPANAAILLNSGDVRMDSCPSEQKALAVTGLPVPMPSYIPAGFARVQLAIFYSRSGKKLPVARFSDGLSSFTIFRRCSNCPQMGMQAGHGFGFGNGNGPGFGRGRGRGRGGMGRNNVNCMLKSQGDLNILDIQSAQGNYTLVGEIGSGLLEKIGKSLP
jgi:hypothetical protein